MQKNFFQSLNTMSDEEIYEKLVYIQVKEKITREKLADSLHMSMSYLCNLLNGKRKLSMNRKRLFLAFLKLYEEKIITFE